MVIPASLFGNATQVNVINTMVDDRTNYFDDWASERTAMGIPDTSFGWSRDSDFITTASVLPNINDRLKFLDKYSYYMDRAKLRPQTSEVSVSGGNFTVNTTLDHHGVTLLEISKVQ